MRKESHTAQEERERRFTLHLLEILNIPKDTYKQGDKPDGTIVHNGKKIGIEVSEFVWSEQLRGKEEVRDKICCRVEQILENCRIPPVYVSVLFHKGKLQNHEEIACRLAQFIIEKVKNSPSTSFEYEFSYFDLKKACLEHVIDSLRVSRRESLKKLHVSLLLGSCIPEFSPEHIQQRIDEKDKKVDRWLNEGNQESGKKSEVIQRLDEL